MPKYNDLYGVYGVTCARCVYYNAADKWCDMYMCEVDDPQIRIHCDIYKRRYLCRVNINKGRVQG